MKKKIFGGIAIVAMAVAVAFNVTLGNQNQDKASILALANVEALAEGEDGGWNSFFDIWTYGLFKDDKTIKYDCTVTTATTETMPSYDVDINAKIPVNGVQLGGEANYNSGTKTTVVTITYKGKRTTCEKGGDTNCDAKECND